MKNPLLLAFVVVLLSPAWAAGDEKKDEDKAAEMARKKADIVLKARVNRAIDRGAAWLVTQQKRDGSFKLDGNQGNGPFPASRHRFGETALATLTLAHCGYDAERIEIRKALGYLKKHWRGVMRGDYWPQGSSYSLCITVMALHKLFAQPGDKDGNGRDNRYASARKSRDNPCGYPAWAKKVIRSILDWIVENRAKEGTFRYPGDLPSRPAGPAPGGPGGMGAMPNLDGPEDMSNTQYALLALWMGSRCGYRVDHRVLEHVAMRLLALQEKKGPAIVRRPDPEPRDAERDSPYAPFKVPGETSDTDRDHARGFGYVSGMPATGAMTSAGLSSLVIVKAMLMEMNKLSGAMRTQLDKGIWDAIAWHVVNYDLTQNPPDGPMWHYYYLYGLERAFVIAEKRYCGEHDWYREGAQLLVDAQKKNGQWDPESALSGWGGPRGPGGPGPGGPGGPAGAGGGPPGGFRSPYSMSMHDTCFALLFLKRAAFKPRTPVLRNPSITEGGKPLPKDETAKKKTL